MARFEYSKFYIPLSVALTVATSTKGPHGPCNRHNAVEVAKNLVDFIWIGCDESRREDHSFSCCVAVATENSLEISEATKSLFVIGTEPFGSLVLLSELSGDFVDTSLMLRDDLRMPVRHVDGFARVTF